MTKLETVEMVDLTLLNSKGFASLQPNRSLTSRQRWVSHIEPKEPELPAWQPKAIEEPETIPRYDFQGLKAQQKYVEQQQLLAAMTNEFCKLVRECKWGEAMRMCAMEWRKSKRPAALQGAVECCRRRNNQQNQKQ